MTLVPQEMGRQAGSKGEFTAPVSRDYAYSGKIKQENTERESTSEVENSDNGFESELHPDFLLKLQSIPPALAAMINTTFHIDDIGDNGVFPNRVVDDLLLIYNTETGKAMFESIHASSKSVTIIYSMGVNEIDKYDSPNERFFQENKKQGAGTGSVIRYNPTLLTLEKVNGPWGTRPPAIALAH